VSGLREKKGSTYDLGWGWSFIQGKRILSDGLSLPGVQGIREKRQGADVNSDLFWRLRFVPGKKLAAGHFKTQTIP
jgi:hypothetical protein